MDISYSSFKNNGKDTNRTKYLNNIGNRLSKGKHALYAETYEKFPKNAIMLTEPSECELLKMLVQVSGAKKGIEIGTFTGYSALCMAEGLPDDGKLICFDVSEEFTDLAKKHWKLNGVDHKIELILGDGTGTVKTLLDNTANLGAFDFAYVDADKHNYPVYYEVLLKLLKPNGFIIFDNILLQNKVVDENNTEEGAVALRNLAKALQADERVDINMLDIADGISIVRKK